MTNVLKIEFNIDEIDLNALQPFRGCALFLMTAIQGSVQISDGQQLIKMDSCPLLQVSYNLIYNCVMPLLYGTTESTLSESVDIVTVLDKGYLNVRTTFPQGSGGDANMTFSPLQALAEAGRFHAELLKALFAADDKFRTDSRVKACLAFASVQLKP